MMSKRRGIMLAAVLAACLVGLATVRIVYKPVQDKEVTITDTGTMRLQSPDFEPNRPIPSRFTCDGENVNPTLSITGVPDGTVSLALIMDDPDAPLGTWVHWLVWNIPPQTAEIATGSLPAGVGEGITSFGKAGYGGPCPPSGTHRYFFKLYALDQNLTLTAAAKVQDLETAMAGHILDKAGLVGVYGR